MILLSILAALVPTFLYLLLLWWLDKYEKEPWGLFLAAFAWGCVPAIILSIIFELVLDIPLSALVESASEALSRVVVAPVVEEGIKGLAVLLIFLIRRREFDGLLDGIIYGAVVGFGFGMTENLLYFIQNAGDPMVILLRTLPFGLNHAFFTAFTGASLGLARQSRQRWKWILFFPLGLLVAMSFHGVHNLAVGMGCPGLLFALVSDWGGITVILVVAFLSWGQEKRWIRQELAEEVTAGLMAPADYQAVQTIAKRIGARLWIWRKHGWRAFRLLGRFFNLATELAFRKHHLRMGTVRWQRPDELELLRARVRQARGALLNIMGVS